MKKYRAIRTCILSASLAIEMVTALAIAPLMARAQSTPAVENAPAINNTNASTSATAGNATTGNTPSRPLYPSPVQAYTRPTEKEKLRLFAFDALGPYPFASAALTAGIQTAHNTPREWGSGWDGFGKRVGSSFGVSLVTTTTRYGMAEILREDTAYYACGCEGFFPRVRHALISTVTARRGTDGHTEFSFPGIVAPYAGSMTSLAWYPSRYGVKDGFEMGSFNLLGQAGGNLALEFIYGGPHALFKNARSSIPQGGTTRAQRP